MVRFSAIKKAPEGAFGQRWSRDRGDYLLPGSSAYGTISFDISLTYRIRRRASTLFDPRRSLHRRHRRRRPAARPSFRVRAILSRKTWRTTASSRCRRGARPGSLALVTMIRDLFDFGAPVPTTPWSIPPTRSSSPAFRTVFGAIVCPSASSDRCAPPPSCSCSSRPAIPTRSTGSMPGPPRVGPITVASATGAAGCRARRITDPPTHGGNGSCGNSRSTYRQPPTRSRC